MKRAVTDRKAHRDLVNREVVKARQHDADLRAVLATEGGRRFLMLLLGDEYAAILSSGFVIEPLEMAFHAGRRDLGIKLYNEVQRVAADLYQQALAEAAAARQLDEAFQRQAEETAEENPRADSNDE